MIEKLATGSVSKIYLQFGTDINSLQKGLEFIRKNSKSDVTVAGSIFLPTKKLIAQQKFRPWNGVFLSPEFLNGPEEATVIVSEMIRVYEANDVEMLWEAPGIRTEKDMGIVRELLGATRAGSSSEISDDGNLVDKTGASPKRVPARETTFGRSEASVTKRPKKNIDEKSETTA